MAEIESAAQATVRPVDGPVNLIPVGLKEAALDSPTFRATALHFGDQVDAIERWLEGYVKSVSRLTSEVVQFESVVNAFLTHSVPPAGLSEAIVDHDYALLVMKRFSEGARESWNQTFKGVKRYDAAVVDPIKAFLSGELRAFKDARRALDTNQKNFDNAIARYLSQSKTKEASSLREDAFQVHEARKGYLKASLDISVASPVLRDSLDKLLVRIFTEQWKEIRLSREATAGTFARLNNEMERVRGWSKEMDNSERAFKRELIAARKQIEDKAAQMIKPSRDLADYETSTVPYLGSATGATVGKAAPMMSVAQEKGEKQGWLFLKTVVGKPARTVWSRRWFFVKNGIFGWLIQGPRSGGVEESEKTGVLLCGVKPAFQEERRFCFEVKTKDTSIVLQAETQTELSDWIGAFEIAKRKALDDPSSIETSPLSPGADMAFAITPPIAPEFAARTIEGTGDRIEEVSSGLAAPEPSALQTRASFDVGVTSRRVVSVEKEPEGTRERIIQKLDLAKRATAALQPSQPPAPMGGGIASLISASHTVFPVATGVIPQPTVVDSAQRNPAALVASSLAPSTLANPPAPTNLSHTAVLISSERGISLGGRTDGSGMPGGIMANLWGSINWGYVNRIGDESKDVSKDPPKSPMPPLTPTSNLAGSVDDVGVMESTAGGSQKANDQSSLDVGLPQDLRHRKTMSATGTTQPALPGQVKSTLEEVESYPSFYPVALRAQNAQFRILFPSVPPSEKLVLVFRATWNPNEQQEFPGRVYVTEREIYFYSNYLGLVLITGVSLTSLAEVTAAPGRDCDFLYLLLKDSGRMGERRRITVRVFLDSLRLLQRRLAFLVENANSSEPSDLEEIIKALLKLEVVEPQRSLSVDSWEDLHYDADDLQAEASNPPTARRERNVKANLRIDGDLYGDAGKTGREVQKFQLPRQPVKYAPQGMQASIAREFQVSAKALFHVMFGDKSAVFQLLYSNLWADIIVQKPWSKQSAGVDGRFTRHFSSQGQKTLMADTQMIDVMNDHLCYVVSHHKQPWRLPYSKRFHLTTKLVITHSAKSRCKLAIYQKITWHSNPPFSYLRSLVEKQALNTLEAEALDLTTVAMDQVAKLGSHSKTNRAIEIFGNIGVQAVTTQIDTSNGANIGASAPASRVRAKKRSSMLTLIISDMMIRLHSVLNMFLDLLIALGRGSIRVFTAHTLLVMLLASSALYNGWFGYRDSLEWWHERTASTYMSRLGVKPDPMISRGVYLKDIDEIVKPQSNNDTFGAFGWQDGQKHGGKTCRSTFRETLSTSVLGLDSARAQKLRRSRDSIAKYRHDLLVAIRVVNRVEHDIVRSEWEEWVRQEESNCARVEKMLRAQLKDGWNTTSEELGAVVGEGFAEYCADCRYELADVRKGMAWM